RGLVEQRSVLVDRSEYLLERVKPFIELRQVPPASLRDQRQMLQPRIGASGCMAQGGTEHVVPVGVYLGRTADPGALLHFILLTTRTAPGDLLPRGPPSIQPTTTRILA